jgi:hypothetical protein
MTSKTRQNYKSSSKDRPKEKGFAFEQGNRAELLCKYCSAVYESKHWQPIAKLNPQFIDRLKKTVCPACHAQKGLVSDGTLHLTGSFMDQHRQEILNIILRTEEKENARDILNRIERIDSRPKEITIYTGKNQLAVEIGNKVAAAYKGGKLEITWSKNDKPVEVKWHKDIEKKIVVKKIVIKKSKKK